jgi:hypothetical protein
MYLSANQGSGSWLRQFKGFQAVTGSLPYFRKSAGFQRFGIVAETV